MISSSQIWIGSFPEAYEDDIRIWTKEKVGDSGDLHVIDCAEINLRKIPESLVPFDPDLLLNVFSSTSLFLDGGKTVLIKNAQLWDVVEEFSRGRGRNKVEHSVWQLIEALNLLEEVSEDVNIGIAFHTGADPSEDVMKFMINGQDDVNDYSLSYSDPNEVAKWIVMWLSVRGFTIKESEALRIAEHLGVEINIVPTLIGALRSYIEIGDPDEPVTYKRLLPNLGTIGLAEIWKIMGACESGDQELVYENCLRLQESGTRAMLGSLRITLDRISNYMKVLDNDSYRPTRISEGAAYYLRRSAKQLGRQRLLACYQFGLETDAALKGLGADLKTSNNSASGEETSDFINLHLFYSFVAGQFAASAKSKGAR